LRTFLFYMNRYLFIGLLVVLHFLFQTNLLSQSNPFNCGGELILKYSSGNGNILIGSIDSLNLNFDVIANNNQLSLNLIAYNVQDNFIYTVTHDRKLYRIDSEGIFTSLGTVTGLSSQDQYVVEAFNSNGRLFIADSNGSSIKVINITSSPPTHMYASPMVLIFSNPRAAMSRSKFLNA
jgi:hypothetical protein